MSLTLDLPHFTAHVRLQKLEVEFNSLKHHFNIYLSIYLSVPSRPVLVCLSALSSSVRLSVLSSSVRPVLSSSVLSSSVLSCPVLVCPVLVCLVLSCPRLSCPRLSCPVLSSSVRLSCPIHPSVLSCPMLSILSVCLSCPVYNIF